MKRLDLFENLVKQRRTGMFFHANLFHSQDRLTNELFCEQVAKMLVCEGEGDGCETCGSCVKVEKRTNPDVKFFGNTKFTVGDVEEILEDQVLKPMISSCKVYVINNVDVATIQAQNKLLKVLEEPNKNVFFVLCATNLDAVLPTVKSRCKLLTIPPFSFEQAKSLLEGGASMSRVLFSQSGGYIGKLSQLLTGGDFAESLDIARGVVFEMKSSKQVLQFSSRLSSSKQNFLTRLCLIQDFYRDVLMALLGEKNLQQNNEYSGQIEQIVEQFTSQALIEIIERIDLCKKQFDANVNIGMIADGLLMKILEVKYLCKQK